MADQKRWFKVWTSILSDDDFDPSIPGVLSSVGRFVLLGAYLALHGSNGICDIRKEKLFTMLQVKNIDELHAEISLKNVQFEEGKSDNSKFTVIMKNWRKYQMDSTGYERLKKHRKQKNDNGTREEKIREEKIKIREEKNKPPLSPLSGDGKSDVLLERFNLFWEKYPKKKSKGDALKAWLKLNPSEQLLETIISTIGRAKTSKEWQKDEGQYVPYPASWLNAIGWEDEYIPAQPDVSKNVQRINEVLAEMEELDAKGRSEQDCLEISSAIS
ncbi:MAG: hypothetical protein A2W23_00160 [Planctomycetes bacterium RBG_16_43_13]|nr:MAG: hypothetical protein A2W23_00160 [Planctomycetes bacterium RBG_16_43_13]